MVRMTSEGGMLYFLLEMSEIWDREIYFMKIYYLLFVLLLTLESSSFAGQAGSTLGGSAFGGVQFVHKTTDSSVRSGMLAFDNISEMLADIERMLGAECGKVDKKDKLYIHTLYAIKLAIAQKRITSQKQCAELAKDKMKILEVLERDYPAGYVFCGCKELRFE